MIVTDVSKLNRRTLDVIAANSNEKNTVSKSYSIDGDWYLILTKYMGGWHASLSRLDNHILTVQEAADMIQELSLHKVVPKCERIGMNQMTGSKVVHFYPQSQVE